MPSVNERTRNNVRAGMFVSAAIVLGLAVIVALTDFASTFFRRTSTYTVTFTVASGVTNLQKGSDVRVGGMSLGQVTDIDPRFEGDRPLEQIDVRFSLDRRVPLFADAVVVIAAPIIGSDAWLSIPSVGTTMAGPPPNNALSGATSVGLLTAILGTENSGKAQDIIDNVREFSAFLGSLQAEYDSSVKPIITDVAAVVSDIRQQRWPQWASGVDRVIAWADRFTTNLDAALAEAHGLLTDSRTIIAENRPSIRNAVVNVESTTADAKSLAQKLNTETIAKVHRILDSGEAALASARSTLEQLSVDYEKWSIDVGEALANANLASQQLKLASIETRRSPWKLLYRPSAEELEHELLYEAARSFALAAADLKDSAASVRRVLDNHASQVSANPELFQRIQQNLLDSLSKYEKAQTQLLDILAADAPQP